MSEKTSKNAKKRVTFKYDDSVTKQFLDDEEAQQGKNQRKPRGAMGLHRGKKSLYY